MYLTYVKIQTIKKRQVSCIPVVTLGVDSWTVADEFELLPCRRVLRILWMVHVSNKNILEHINNEREQNYDTSYCSWTYMGSDVKDETR